MSNNNPYGENNPYNNGNNNGGNNPYLGKPEQQYGQPQQSPQNNPYGQVSQSNNNVNGAYGNTNPYGSNEQAYNGAPNYNSGQNYNAGQQQYNGSAQNYNYNNGQQQQYPNAEAPNYNANQMPNYGSNGNYDYANQNVDYIPRPRVGFVEAIKGMFKNYAVFNGRASRSEYWWNVLAISVLTIPFAMILGIDSVVNAKTVYDDSSGEAISSTDLSGMGILSAIILFVVILATIVPYIALTVRRLHDANLSGWFYLVTFIPYIGGFILLALTVQDSKPDGNRFDQNVQPWVPERAKLPNVAYKN